MLRDLLSDLNVLLGGGREGVLGDVSGVSRT